MDNVKHNKMWSHRREGVSWTRFRSMQERRYRTVSS